MLLGSLRKGWHLHPCRKHGRFPFRRRCHWELTKRSTTHGVGCVVFQEPGFLPWHFFLVAPVEWEARHRESSFELFFSAGWVFVTKILGFHTFVSWRRAANSGETAFHTLQRNLRLELLPSNSLWLLMWLIGCVFFNLFCYGWAMGFEEIGRCQLLLMMLHSQAFKVIDWMIEYKIATSRVAPVINVRKKQ